MVSSSLMRASTTKILRNDWPALFAALFAPGIWGVHVVYPLLRLHRSAPPLWLPVVLSAMAVAALAWRIARIRRLFAQGRTATGVVVRIRFVRDRARLDFAFDADGRRVETWSPVHKTRDTIKLDAGQELEILYDPRAPRRAVPRDLFAA